METKLPIYKIMGIPFIVDVDLALMRHHKDQANFMQFSDMTDMGTHYEVDFDVKHEMAELYEENRPGLKLVKIPPMVQLDPERVALKYNIEVSKLPSIDAELRSHPGWFQQRKSGKQPTIKIWGQTYFVNVNFGLLEPENLFHNPIRLTELKKDPTNTYYFGILDTNEMSIIQYDDSIAAIPENAVIIKVPHERVLDPFFIRLRSMGWEDHPERMGHFPVRYDMEAQILNWKDSPIALLINKNNKKKKMNAARGKRP
jgi:hypothetical protein